MALAIAALAVRPPSVAAQAWWQTTKRAPAERMPAPAQRLPWFDRYRTPPSGVPSLVMPRPGRVVLATVNEVEPNDSISQAGLVALGDALAGTIDPAGDVDYFAIDLVAGTLLDLDVDASQVGSPLNPVIALFDVDSLTLLALNDDFDGLDSRIMYPILADGRYFVGIVSFGGASGGPSHTYTLAFGEFSVAEAEPNNTAAEANLVALGDTTTGALAPPGDVDYFAVDLPGAVLLDVTIAPLAFGDFFATVLLFDVDGTTLLDSASIFDNPPQIRAYIPAAGRYYVVVQEDLGGGGPATFYELTLTTRPPGPGDPTTLFAAGLAAPWRMAAGTAGELYVIDISQSRILVVDANGTVTTFASGFGNPVGIVVDGFGDVLVLGVTNTGEGVVWRFDANGLATVFLTNIARTDIAVGPDGDIWVVDCGTVCPAFLRFDPFGNIKDTVDVSSGPVPRYLAFSPAGELHYSDGFQTVSKLADSAPQVVIVAPEYLEGLAFDRDGYLYVANGFRGTVALYDPSYQPVATPFALTNLGGPLDLVFGTDASGATTARLLASNLGFNVSPPYAGGIVEMNPAGMRAPGWPVAVQLLRVVSASLVTGVVGADYADTLRVVDPPGAVAWSITEGTLPPGLTLAAQTGVISGVPQQRGTFAFTARAESGPRLGLRQLAIQVGEPTVSVASTADALLGVAGALTPEQERFLDIQGNANGEFDIGDLRAFLRVRGQLPAAGRAAPPATKGRDGR
ncbi:MAG: putative Ig domain-containing protein [Gemmatimonadetes bacterium]|nr:putative Ig domain-containing protein [Gemmatimonadota bacterium]